MHVLPRLPTHTKFQTNFINIITIPVFLFKRLIFHELTVWQKQFYFHKVNKIASTRH